MYSVFGLLSVLMVSFRKTLIYTTIYLSLSYRYPFNTTYWLINFTKKLEQVGFEPTTVSQ